ncbi:MAG: TetR/AcrR family transcriptional regulator [Solirubrobacterales bacterium]|nr:TetR/AcrR family transcriptional regulator [Solirubrobacterales bacterium]
MPAAAVTEQGRATRERIVRMAAELVAERGPAGTSVEAVAVASNASKSQLYHYFGDKRGLIAAVIEHQCASVLGVQARLLASVSDWDDLEHWADAVVAGIEQHAARGGCPLGTLAAELADVDEDFRAELEAAFETWRGAIHGALLRLRENGLLSATADLATLSSAMLASVQGGLLLTKTSRDTLHLRAALAGAIAHLSESGLDG